jgi:hypothetical protein
MLVSHAYPPSRNKKLPHEQQVLCHDCWLNFQMRNKAYIWTFFGETWVWTQGFALAKQELYSLSHTSSPFCSDYFGDEVSRSICPGWPQTVILLILASLVVGKSVFAQLKQIALGLLRTLTGHRWTSLDETQWEAVGKAPQTWCYLSNLGMTTARREALAPRSFGFLCNSSLLKSKGQFILHVY